ncbi:MAG: flippase [Erysipelotrichaceae bacterium]|nr:flippase [Erysipelotrichaceae bacterium]
MSNKRIVVNASWIMIGRIFQLALTFVTTMLVTRYLGPTEYGKITYVYSYIQLFLPLCALGMNDIAVKELVDDREHNDEILGTMIVLRLIASAVSMLCSVLAVSVLNDGKAYIIIATLQSIGLMFQSFDGIMYFYQSKLLSKKSGLVYALSYVITSIIRIIGILLKQDYRFFALAMSLDFAVIAILLLTVYKKDGHGFKVSRAMAKRLLEKSRYYIFAGLLVVIYGKVTDTLLLGKMVNETSVGYYAAATMLCNAWPFVLTAIIDSLSPVIIDAHKTDHEAFEQKLKQLYAIIFYISVLAAVMITLLSKLIILIIYGPEYIEASVPMKIYAWSTAFSYIGVARTIWMQCEGKTRYETAISLVGALTSIFLNYFLIRAYGLIGAAMAAVLTQLITNFLCLFAMKDIRENAKLIADAILLKGVLNRRDSHV